MRSAYGAQASDNLTYLKNPIWWAGMVTSACSLLFNCCVLTILQCSGLGWMWVLNSKINLFTRPWLFLARRPVANFAAYTFAPPILVTPLGALSVLIGYDALSNPQLTVSQLTPWLSPCSAVLASFLLGEELGHLGRVGCTLCLLGSLIIVLHAPEDKPINTVDEILHFAIQPGTPSQYLKGSCH